MNLQPLDPTHPQALALLAQSDAYHQALYPADSNHLVPPTALQGPEVCFVGAFEGDQLLGCGAFKRMDDDGRYGEIKRLFVPDLQRGRGVARLLMQHLETQLRDEGFALARLETGIRQPEAIGLYVRLGYRERGPFGAYQADPLSLFLEKTLG